VSAAIVMSLTKSTVTINLLLGFRGLIVVVNHGGHSKELGSEEFPHGRARATGICHYPSRKLSEETVKGMTEKHVPASTQAAPR